MKRSTRDSRKSFLVRNVKLILPGQRQGQDRLIRWLQDNKAKHFLGYFSNINETKTIAADQWDE